MSRIMVLHGPNLNLLGAREPEIYGSATLEDIDSDMQSLAVSKGVDLTTLQSNAESVLVEAIQNAANDGTGFIVINPAALTHTSVALRDALLAVDLPFIEVHLSNVYAREAFRQKSYLSDIATAVITGLGAAGYQYALSAAIDALEK
ncbi:MAG: type II 3-dehydroquinate dehydratase [Pseudomonadales bacterium]|nr:type II 3-dehydroquinate dehydratase [Pseudomonadales bacterium]